MVLRYSVGKAITGDVCAADVAFDRFERYVERFEIGPAWNWFVERVTSLEVDLAAAGGLDERIADQLEATGSFFGSAEAYERYERADYICWQLEEAAIAFVVTLQTRLNALLMAARAVYVEAAKEDLLAVTAPSGLALFPSPLRAVWDVANYAKHCDEWGTALNNQQRATFDALLKLGVAAGTHDNRALARLPTIEALLAISGESCLRDAIQRTLKICVTGGLEIAAHIQSDFAALVDAVNAARSASRKRFLSSAWSTPRD